MNILLEIVMAITIVGICAALAEFLVGYSPGTLAVVTLVGVVGAYLGNGIAIALERLINLPPLILVRIGTLTFDIVWTVIGACVILFALSVLRSGRGRIIFARGAQE